jgi:hypothetical protein
MGGVSRAGLMSVRIQSAVRPGRCWVGLERGGLGVARAPDVRACGAAGAARDFHASASGGFAAYGHVGEAGSDRPGDRVIG